MLCFLSSLPQLFPLQLMHSSLQRKCVPPQLQAEKRRLICLTFAPGSTWVCPWAPSVSHTSFSLQVLFHSIITQASPSNNTAVLPLTRPEKEILLGFSGFPLRQRHFGYFKSHSIPLRKALQGPLQLRHLFPIYAETDHPLWKNIFLIWALSYAEIRQI